MNAPRKDELTQHADALRRLARKLVGGDGPWEDLVQGTYLAALERPPKWLSRAWLARVLENRALDIHRRKQTARQEPVVDEATLVQGQGRADNAIEERIEVHAKLVAAVRTLKEPYRSTVFSRYFDDLTPTQIAAQVGVPVKTVKTRLARGIAQLRERLDRDIGPDERGGLLALVPLAFPHRIAPGTFIASVSTTGVGLMLKKVALACAIALGCFGLYQLQSQDPLKPQASLAADAPDVELPLANAEASTVKTLVPPQATSRREVDGPVAASASPTDFGSLLIRVSSKAGTPIQGAYVGVRTAFPDAPPRGICFESTDELGIVRARSLAPGSYYIFSDQGDDDFETVVAGEERTVELHTEETVAVQGLVVDGRDRPVAGASIWLANGRVNWMGGRIVGESDASGRFHLPQVLSGLSLGAFASGHAPSALVDLDSADKSISPVEVRLVLSEVGGDLAGIVRDPAGEIVVGARVAVGKALPYRPMSLGPGSAEVWSPRSQLTNEQGRFYFVGVPLGAQRVTVRAEGFPVLQETVEVLSGGTPECELTLPVGAWIEGRVVDLHGVPVAGAFVRAFDQNPTNLDDSYVDRAQFNFHGTFSYPFAEADENGEYAISGVRPGTVHVFANPRADDNQIMPFDREVIQLAPLAHYRWDAVLNTGLAIEGHVLFKNGDPIDEIHVIALDETSGKHFSCITDAEGHFEIIQLADEEHTVWVQLWPRLEKDSAEPIQQGHVRPGGTPLRLVASVDEPEAVEDGTVRAEVDDRAKTMLQGAGAMLVREASGSFQTAEVKQSKLNFGYVTPGPYRVFLMSGSMTVFRSERFEVSSGEDVDLGTLITQPTGSALLRLTRPAGTELIEVSAGCHLQGAFWDSEKIGTATEHRFDVLAAGPYILRLRGPGIANRNLEFQVLAAEESLIEYTLEPAVQRDIEIWQPEGVEVVEARVVFEYVDGRVIDEWPLGRSRVTTRPIVLFLEFPLGRLRIRVEASGGLKGSTEFEMTTLEAGQAPVKIELE